MSDQTEQGSASAAAPSPMDSTSTSDPALPPPPDDSRRKLRRRLGRVAIVVAVFLASLGAFSAWGWIGLNREDRFANRDPKTGVIVGLEARDLGPRAEDGATTAVLMIHGFIGSRLDYADLGERLAAAGLHVRQMRLPGHGTTPRDFARQGPQALQDAVEAEFRALKAHYREVDVIGFSMGGALATLLTARVGTGPDGVGRLALAAPYYGIAYKWFYALPPETWNVLLRWVVPAVPKNDYFILVNRKDDLGKWFTYRIIPTRCIATLVALGKQARRPETLAAARCPVLLVMSTGDNAASPARAKAAFARISSADKKALWVTRSNHMIFWDYDREEAKAAFVEFLARRHPPANSR